MVSHCCESVAVAAVRLVVHRLDWLIAVSPILADPDKNNCAEQMHDSHPSGRIRPLDQSEVVRTVGCSCPGRPELGRLQYLCEREEDSLL